MEDFIMKVQIRSSVFETNSSSVHSLTMCKSDEYADWVAGKTMYMPEKRKFLPTKEAEEYNRELAEKNHMDFSNLDYVYYEEYYLSYDKFMDYYCSHYYYDTFKDEKDGIVAFGYYGTE